MDQEKNTKLEKVIHDDYGNIEGIIVQKDGKNVYEKYFNGYTAENAIHTSSVTKSVFSALMGIAIEKGFIKSVDQKVLEIFPDYAVQADEKIIQGVMIRNLLNMTAPYKCQSEPYEEFFASDNWVNAALDLLGGKENSGEFRYSPIIGTHILGGILAKATGQSVLDFATENLFSPLGIHVHNVVLRNKEEQMAWYSKVENTSGWVVDPQGINTAGWGLTLTPVDMTKIGQLYLNNGMWGGKQIVSSEWIAESTREQSRCVQWGNIAYGYLWWIIDGDCYAAMGDGGNTIYINTKKKMVISIASLFVPDAKDRIELIKKYIEPAFEDCE